VRPEVVDAKERSSFRRFIRKTVTGQVGNNDIERVFGPSTELHRVGEHGNYFGEAIKRIRIAVCQNDRKGIRTFSALVDEMQADTFHIGSEMSESVEGSFVLPPVVGVMPVADEFPQVIDVGAQGPLFALCMIRKPCVFEPLAKVS